MAQKILPIKGRIEAVKTFRLQSKKLATQKFAEKPYRYTGARHIESNSIIVPRVSSERRKYVPIGFLNADTIVKDSAYAIYNADIILFGILTSHMHMTWVRTVAGRLKSDYRYSSNLCYNTFPFPMITEKQKEEITELVFNVLDEREQHSEKTLAELYDPDTMPQGLKEAHHQLDLAIEKCYRNKPFENDEERLEYLFKLYEEMTRQKHE